MPDIAHSIDLNLRQKLEDRSYRLRFFWAESSALIAEALIALRRRRGLNQTQVAELTGTKQPAISRVEQADYQNWNIKTLRTYAEALDARVRVLIQPSEDVLIEYEGDEDVNANVDINPKSAQSNVFIDFNTLIPGNNTFGALLSGFAMTNNQTALGAWTPLRNLGITTEPYGPMANPAMLVLDDPEKIQLKKLVAQQQRVIADKDEKITALNKQLSRSSTPEPVEGLSLPIGQRESAPVGIFLLQ
jgi:transcriptional regulator with XRE-family HTH domain